MAYSILRSLFRKRNDEPEFLYDDEKIYNFLQFTDFIDNMDICNSDYCICNENYEAILFKYNVCWNEGNISSEFPYLASLEELEITGNYNTFCLKNNTISENIFNLPKLRNLYLKSFLTSDIPLSINQTNSINYISIVDSKLEDFPTQLVKLQNLKTLNITNTIIDHIPKEFTEFPSLEFLLLNGNTYKSKELVIPNHIKTLDVSNEGFTSIFKDNSNKELLSFTCENTTNNNMKNDTTTNDNFNEDIFDSLANYKKLTYLNLKNNNLIRKIPSTIKELTSLEKLDLDYMNIEEVSEEYFKLQNLKKNLVLRNKKSNSKNLTSFKPCEKDETDTPCFEISEENDNSNIYKKIGIIASIVIAISVVVTICRIVYSKLKKRNKFEKIRKKIIDDVTNEIEKSNSQNSNNFLFESNHNNHDDNNNSNNRNNPNSQVNIIVDDESPLNNDVTNVVLPNNNNDPTITNDISESNFTLPTYMESISNSNNSTYYRIAQNLDRKLSPPRTEDSKKELTNNIVDAEVIVPGPMDYYEERLQRKIMIENRRNALYHNSNNNDSNKELQIDDDKHSFSNLTNENVLFSRIQENNDTEISNINSIDNNNETEHIVIADSIELNNNENVEVIVDEDINEEPLISDVLGSNSNEKEFSEKKEQNTYEPNNRTSLIKDVKDSFDLTEENSSFVLNNNKQNNDFTETPKLNVDASSITDAEEINKNTNNILSKNHNNSTIEENNIKNNVNINKINNNLVVNNESEYLCVYHSGSMINNDIQHKISQSDLENKSITEKDIETKSVTSSFDDNNKITEAEEIIIKDDNNNDNKQINN